MPLIGYARVSTLDQTLDPQLAELRQAGCLSIHEEHASGADRSRPALQRLLAAIRPGDTLVVVRLDRLARSLAHLLQVIETLEARGAHFRSLGDPIDTATPQGRFSLQVMGAVAELERALIRERTKAGLRSARAQGRIGGNPALKAGDREAIRKLRMARDETYFRKLEASADGWLPLVRRHRPAMAWDDLARLVQARTGNRPDPFAGRRKSNPKIRRNLAPYQTAGERDANSIPLELLAGCRCHIQSPSWRASLSEDRKETAKGPDLLCDMAPGIPACLRSGCSNACRIAAATPVCWPLKTWARALRIQ